MPGAGGVVAQQSLRLRTWGLWCRASGKLQKTAGLHEAVEDVMLMILSAVAKSCKSGVQDLNSVGKPEAGSLGRRACKDHDRSILGLQKCLEDGLPLAAMD